ncbi:MAG: hypothetical protein MZV64_71015 [Ignavibacteriales bacterium]|nr:hypothetical protein [Ignavibacteriales bacterium]
MRKRLSALPKAEAGPAGPNIPTTPREITAEPPKSEILVAVVKRDVVVFYQKMALAAGLKLSGLGWLSYANARVVEAASWRPTMKPWPSSRSGRMKSSSISWRSILCRFSRGASVKLPHSLTALPLEEGSTSPDSRTPASPAETAPDGAVASPTHLRRRIGDRGGAQPAQLRRHGGAEPGGQSGSRRIFRPGSRPGGNPEETAQGTLLLVRCRQQAGAAQACARACLELHLGDWLGLGGLRPARAFVRLCQSQASGGATETCAASALSPRPGSQPHSCWCC